MPIKRTARQPAHEPGVPEPEQQADPAAVRPGPEPDGEQAVETGRPYRDFVEAEARQYWQEITKPGRLVKPTQPDLHATEVWALRYDARDSAIASNNYAEAEAAAMQPWPGADANRDMEPERPYQASVESEARKYWQEMGKEHTLAKPAQEDIRAAALPILCLALRNRAGNTRYKAVVDVVQHAKEKGWIKRFQADASESSSYIDALIQLADDTNRLAREIPLPDHPPPRHPRIYYTIEFVQGRRVPVPRDDAIIHAHYVYSAVTGQRLTEEANIYPVEFLPDGVPERTLPTTQTPLRRLDPTGIHRFMLEYICPVYYGLTFERARKPLNQRGVCVWFDWIKHFNFGTYVYSDRLRDHPYLSWLVFSPYPPVLQDFPD